MRVTKHSESENGGKTPVTRGKWKPRLPMKRKPEKARRRTKAQVETNASGENGEKTNSVVPRRPRRNEKKKGTPREELRNSEGKNKAQYQIKGRERKEKPGREKKKTKKLKKRKHCRNKGRGLPKKRGRGRTNPCRLPVFKKKKGSSERGAEHRHIPYKKGTAGRERGEKLGKTSWTTPNAALKKGKVHTCPEDKRGKREAKKQPGAPHRWTGKEETKKGGD